MNKRGLSDIVTTVLIILLVLAAVVIIWQFVKPVIQSGAENVQTAQFTSSYSISDEKLIGGVLSFNLMRKSGDSPVKGFNIVLSNSSGFSASSRQEFSLDALQSKKVNLVYASLGIDNVDKIVVYPIYLTAQGKEMLSSSGESKEIGLVGSACVSEEILAGTQCLQCWGEKYISENDRCNLFTQKCSLSGQCVSACESINGTSFSCSEFVDATECSYAGCSATCTSIDSNVDLFCGNPDPAVCSTQSDGKCSWNWDTMACEPTGSPTFKCEDLTVGTSNSGCGLFENCRSACSGSVSCGNLNKVNCGTAESPSAGKCTWTGS